MRNGYVPRSALAKVDGGGWTALLAPGCASAWLLYCQIVHRLCGVWPTISNPDGAYRSYARQLWWWVNRFIRKVVAAFPGTSNHGLGMAVDNWNWAAIPAAVRREAAARAGFIFDTPSEPWHMRYLGAAKYTSGVTVKTLLFTTIREDEDMFLKTSEVDPFLSTDVPSNGKKRDRWYTWDAAHKQLKSVTPGQEDSMKLLYGKAKPVTKATLRVLLAQAAKTPGSVIAA